MPNQRDVARLAGISSASVSRYLADPASVQPQTAERIKAAIEEMNYKIDFFARGLKTGRSKNIGILTPATGPFYAQLFFAIQHYLTAHDYYSSVIFTRNIDTALLSSRDRIFSALRNKQLEGIVYFPLMTSEDDEILSTLRAAHEHVMLVDSDGKENGFDQLYIDNRSAGYRAAKSFLELGHREFLFIKGAEAVYSAQQRLAGFTQALAEEGITLGGNSFIEGDFQADRTYRVTLDNWDRIPRFTAVFACNDSSAMGFMKAARDKDKSCPTDYSIIGFDNNVEYAPFVKPGLSSFEQTLNDVGFSAARTLINRIENLPVEKKITTVTPLFIARESLAPPPP